MRVRLTICTTALVMLAANVFCVGAQPAAPVASAPVYVPDTTHQNDPLPSGVLVWDETQKSVDATNGQDFARFVFAFTNTARKVEIGQVTNVTWTTNYTVVTNSGFWSVFSGRKYSSVATVITNRTVATVTNASTPLPVTILNVHPSCGCTTAELPPVPWLLPPGTNSTMRVNVNLAGKSGIVFKTVTVTTDKGRMDLMLRINIQAPPPPKPMSEEERARGIAAAKIDRQAVFKGDCASCHAKNVQGQYGQQLFVNICGVCHEANPRATMVPDLHNLKDPTSEDFWRAWITSGKAGTLMPAFSTAQGGPLNDMQISSLAVYLNAIIPPKAPPPAPAPPAK
jgi:mono/diheme cytochrome c family protein